MQYMPLNYEPETEIEPAVEQVSEQQIRLSAYLLAQADGFNQAPEHYWLAAEQLARRQPR